MSVAVVNSQQWKDCLRYISQRTRQHSYNTWLKPTTGSLDHDKGEFQIRVANRFVADWIREHFGGIIDESLREVLGKTCTVRYVIGEPTEPQNQTELHFGRRHQLAAEQAASQALTPTTCNGHNLNPKYRFESLVVGDFNEFACAASRAVAEDPGKTKYNPLYIYGPTGLGKTHIVQAIGNRILEHSPDKRIMYATSEKFTSDFISAISDRTIPSFTRVYRNVDVLIIDDMQFFTGKESTQEQFFHTFNTLHHLGKQIILTSDRSPKDTKGLEERLLSRFSWGLVTDLQAPDVEARTAILLKKLELDGNILEGDVIQLIADRVSTNVRELEGALTRLLAYASLRGVKVDLNLAQKVLADLFSRGPSELTVDIIQQRTAELFNIPPEMMKAKKKTSHIVLARQVAMHITRSLTSNSLKAIGDAFGGRDHSTVIHACDLITRKMSQDRQLRERVNQLSQSLIN
ncbi:MAG: chromosomal replication initiator protein DnaA [Gammaproteobacteria bacterium]